MFQIALFEPEIPPNTGNIIRLAANTGCSLHLIGLLGFSMDAKSLRRAGLDYHQYSNIALHDNWSAFQAALPGSRIFAFSTKGQTLHTGVEYSAGDILLFGAETRGLPSTILEAAEITAVLRIPMMDYSRSLNLANTVAIGVYEAWRQAGFGLA